MIDPRNYREVAIDLASFKREVDPQFRFLNRMLFWILAVIAGVIGGGFAIYVQIGDIKATSAATGRDVASLIDRMNRLDNRVTRIETSLSEVERLQRESSSVLVRIEARLGGIETRLGARQTDPPLTPIVLNAEEEQAVREAFGLRDLGKGPTKFSIGEQVSEAIIKSMPEALLAKVPKLRGARVALDPVSGAALIVGPGNRVVAIVTPA